MGLETGAMVAGIVDDPDRNVPRATLGGILLAGVVYLMSSVLVMGIVPAAELAALEQRAWGQNLSLATTRGEDAQSARQALERAWQQLTAAQRQEPQLVFSVGAGAALGPFGLGRLADQFPLAKAISISEVTESPMSALQKIRNSAPRTRAVRSQGLTLRPPPPPSAACRRRPDT